MGWGSEYVTDDVDQDTPHEGAGGQAGGEGGEQVSGFFVCRLASSVTSAWCGRIMKSYRAPPKPNSCWMAGSTKPKA